MRVAILTLYYRPERGAPQTRLHELAVGLSDLGHELTVLTGPPHYPTGKPSAGYSPWRVRRDRLDGIRIVRVPMLVRPNRGLVDRAIDHASFAASSAMAAGVIQWSDVVVVESPPLLLGLTAAVFRAIHGRPYLFHAADPWPDYPIEMGAIKNGLVVRAARWIESTAYRNASLITTVSEGLVEHLDANPAAHGKVRLLLNGVDVERFHPERAPAEARAALGWPEAHLTLVYAGSVGLAQGLDTLVEAVAPLRDSGIVLHVVGDGFDRARLSREVALRRLDHIRFHDPVGALEVPTILAAADGILVLLRPGTLNRLSLPTKLVEGLAAGRPLIVAADGVAADVVRSAGAGVTARAGCVEEIRAAIEALSDADERAEMGRRGRKLAESRYERQRVVEQLSGYLDQVRLDHKGYRRP